MKKTIITSIVLTSLAAEVLLFSCKKQEPIQPQNTLPQNTLGDAPVSVNNKLLVFGTTDAYRKLVDNASPEEKLRFTNRVKAMNNFTSYAEYVTSKNPSVLSSADSIDSDFMRTILNEDAAVQIGDYIYKIDVAHEKVFALKAANANQYNDVISGNTANPNVQAFSIGDDVLSLTGNNTQGKGEGVQNVEPDDPDVGGGGGGGSSGGGGSGGIFCNESGIGDQKSPPIQGTYDATIIFNGNPLLTKKRITGGGFFKRYGVYFELNAQVLVEANTQPNDIAVWVKTNDQVGITVEADYYHVRCGNTVGPYSTYTASGGGGEHKFLSYTGSRNLNKVWLRTRFNCEGHETPSTELIKNY